MRRYIKLLRVGIDLWASVIAVSGAVFFVGIGAARLCRGALDFITVTGLQFAPWFDVSILTGIVLISIVAGLITTGLLLEKK